MDDWYDPIVRIVKETLNKGYNFFRPTLEKVYDEYISGKWIPTEPS